MKILVVCQYYYPEPFRITDICETLAQRGHQVTVLTGLPNYPEGRVLDYYRFGRNRSEIKNKVNIIRTYEIGRGNNRIKLFFNYISFALSASLKALFLKEKFDVVFVNQLSPVMMGIPGIVYKKRYRKKMLLYCLDLWPDSLVAGGIHESSVIYKLFREISKWIYKSADMMLVSSNMFKIYFESKLKLQNVCIEHLPQYAEDLFLRSVDAPKDEKVNLVFAGNIGDAQSVGTIIKAAKEIQTHTDIAFHIIGDGSKLDECKKMADSFKLTNITFYGRRPVEEMPGFYSMADAMLITLKSNKVLSYTLPGKIQSYMAAGKPIIGAINGEARYVIEDAECGLCCDAEDYKGLAMMILQFYKSDKKEQMARNAQQYYSERYNKEQFVNRIENILKSLED